MQNLPPILQWTNPFFVERRLYTKDYNEDLVTIIIYKTASNYEIFVDTSNCITVDNEKEILYGTAETITDANKVVREVKNYLVTNTLCQLVEHIYIVKTNKK